MLGLTPKGTSTEDLHPSTEDTFELLQIFFDNVNPLTKVVHAPTLRSSIEKAVAELDRISKGLEALMFAIFSLAVLSLKDDDCQHRFGEDRKTLLGRFRTATKYALARTKFMGTTNMVVLQAFVLHLVSMREVYDSGTIWILAGVAQRIAERIGLHRDGTFLGLPPFETEMRRRLWWQSIRLDYDTADLCGIRKMRNLDPDPKLTKLPSNVNDSDLYPGMASFPSELHKSNEMILWSIQSEFFNFWIKHAISKYKQNEDVSGLWDNYNSKDQISEMDQAIEQLEQIVETKYVRYCDPSVPEQLMALILARMAIKKMHLTAHHPRRWSAEEEPPENERQYVRNLSLNLLEATVMTVTNRSLEGFLWHTASYVPWEALIHVLDWLRIGSLTHEGVKAWKTIEDLFEHHPAFEKQGRNPVYVAVGNLCLRAYSARERASEERGKPLASAPGYIIKLRGQREAAKASRIRIEERNTQNTIVSPDASSDDHVAVNKRTLPPRNVKTRSTPVEPT